MSPMKGTAHCIAQHPASNGWCYRPRCGCCVSAEHACCQRAESAAVLSVTNRLLSGEAHQCWSMKSSPCAVKLHCTVPSSLRSSAAPLTCPLPSAGPASALPLPLPLPLALPVATPAGPGPRPWAALQRHYTHLVTDAAAFSTSRKSVPAIALCFAHLWPCSASSTEPLVCRTAHRSCCLCGSAGQNQTKRYSQL